MRIAPIRVANRRAISKMKIHKIDFFSVVLVYSCAILLVGLFSFSPVLQFWHLGQTPVEMPQNHVFLEVQAYPDSAEKVRSCSNLVKSFLPHLRMTPFAQRRPFPLEAPIVSMKVAYKTIQ